MLLLLYKAEIKLTMLSLLYVGKEKADKGGEGEAKKGRAGEEGARGR